MPLRDNVSIHLNHLPIYTSNHHGIQSQQMGKKTTKTSLHLLDIIISKYEPSDPVFIAHASTLYSSQGAAFAV